MERQEKEEAVKRRKVLLREPHLVETGNAFSALEEKEVSAPAMGLDKEKERTDSRSLPQGRVLVLGNNQVRHSYSAFCARDGKSRTMVYLPRGGIDRVAEGLTRAGVMMGPNQLLFSPLGGK